MRISNSLLYDRLHRDTADALSLAYDAQRQVTTGRRFEQVSDDPVAGVEVLRVQQGLRGVAQYRRNVGGVKTRLDTEEVTLDQLTDLLNNARETAIAQGSATGSAATRATSANEVSAMIDQVVNLGNTRVGNEYIFAGNAVNNPPFAVTAGAVTYAGDTGVRKAELNDNFTIDVNHTGAQLLMSSGVGTALQNLRDALATNNVAGIATAQTQIESAFDQVQTMLGDVGARGRALDAAGSNLDALETTYENRETAAWNVDSEEALSNLAAAQTSLQAAMLAATKVLSTNLVNYLT